MAAHRLNTDFITSSLQVLPWRRLTPLQLLRNNRWRNWRKWRNVDAPVAVAVCLILPDFYEINIPTPKTFHVWFFFGSILIYCLTPGETSATDKEFSVRTTSKKQCFPASRLLLFTTMLTPWFMPDRNTN